MNKACIFRFKFIVFAVTTMLFHITHSVNQRELYLSNDWFFNTVSSSCLSIYHCWILWDVGLYISTTIGSWNMCAICCTHYTHLLFALQSYDHECFACMST